LAGEILLTWPLLRRGWSPSAIFAFGLLTRVEDAAGFLPPPALALSHYAALPVGDRPSFALAAAYHTAYVMGLLTSAILSQRWRPPITVPDRGRRRGAAAAILTLIDAASAGPPGIPHWRDSLAAISERQQDAIAPLLLSISLRRSVAARDLVALRAALRVAAHHDLLRLPAARQALELLQRAPLLVPLVADPSGAQPASSASGARQPAGTRRDDPALIAPSSSPRACLRCCLGGAGADSHLQTTVQPMTVHPRNRLTMNVGLAFSAPPRLSHDRPHELDHGADQLLIPVNCGHAAPPPPVSAFAGP